MLSCMALVDVATVFDSNWIDRLLYKLANLDFQIHLLKTVSLSPFADIPNVLPLSTQLYRLVIVRGWSGLGCTCVPHPFPKVRERRVSTFSCLSERITRPSETHSHVLPAGTARRIHPGFPRNTPAPSTRLEHSH
jgi:hypothetical protein